MGARMPRIGARGVVLAALVLLIPLILPAQEPSLDTVLERAAGYVAEFRDELSNIVSEELYQQQAETSTTSGAGAFPRVEHERIVLRSDFLLVRMPESPRHVEFRDVYEVNGQATRDRDERLSRLFLSGSTAASDQMQSITNESARYNIGLIERSLNTPTLALLFLDNAYQRRFTFERVADSVPLLEFDGSWPTAAQLWVVQYQEVSYRTLIRGKGNRDLPIHGRFWVEPTTGRVVASELVAKDSEVEATVDVRYAFDEGVGHVVPVEMRESYGDIYGTRVDGFATYSNFRQFQVEVEELVPPDEDDPQNRD